MIEEVFLLVVFIFALTSSLIGFIIAHGIMMVMVSNSQRNGKSFS